MNFRPLMNFKSLDRCQHILNLMKDRTVLNLVFTDEKKFDVQQCINQQNYSLE